MKLWYVTSKCEKHMVEDRSRKLERFTTSNGAVLWGYYRNLYGNRDFAMHRDDGPAYEWSDRGLLYREWWSHGRKHRDGGPAIESVSLGDWQRCWYKNGLLHREDGPAIERKSGNNQYWINGVKHEEGVGGRLTEIENKLVITAEKDGGWMVDVWDGNEGNDAFSGVGRTLDDAAVDCATNMVDNAEWEGWADAPKSDWIHMFKSAFFKFAEQEFGKSANNFPKLLRMPQNRHK